MWSSWLGRYPSTRRASAWAARSGRPASRSGSPWTQTAVTLGRRGPIQGELSWTPSTTLSVPLRIRILALALVLAILPTTGEMLELVVHLARHGDVAHEVGDDHGSAPMGTDEHGCSGTFHLCPCHTAQ